VQLEKRELKDKRGTARRENEDNIMIDHRKGRKSYFLLDSSGSPIR
jgi:hypothetical protein